MTIREFFQLCNYSIDKHNCNIITTDNAGKCNNEACLDVANYEDKKIFKFYPYIESNFGEEEIHIDFFCVEG